MIPFAVFSFKRRIRYMMFRFERLSFANKLIIGTVIGVFLWILWGSRSVETTQSAESVERAVQQQVAHYCNFPMRLSGTEGLLSLENMFKQPLFQLEMVQILIRHGDRAPSMVITNMDNEKYDYDCTFKTADLNHKDLFDDYRESTKYFKTQKFVDCMKHHQVLVPGNRTCQYGQLTQRGFLQHFELGKHLHQAYSGLLNAINDGSLMVRSSIRERCVQSAAAFLFGLLPVNSIKKGVTINISSDIWFREDDNGVPYKCPSLLRIWNKYKQRKDYKTHAAAMEPFMKQYAQLLRVSRASLPTITYLTDAIYTRYCHKHPLPCGPGGCVSQEMAAKAMEFASWAFAENYTAVAEVATHPMLIQMAKRMVNKLQQRSPLKFVLYSGHDSTVTPLLLNLGVHDHKKWTPYATNVVFELWKDMLLDSSKTAEPISYYYFRLLVNGKVMTSKMKFCQEVLFNGELCPIQELIFWLSAGSGMQGMDERYQMLCS